MDASFAPQYIFLLKSICIMSQIALHGNIFSMFLTETIKLRAVRKPLPSHQERCLAPRNRYAASLRPETVTILQRDVDDGWKHISYQDEEDLQGKMNQDSISTCSFPFCQTLL